MEPPGETTGAPGPKDRAMTATLHHLDDAVRGEPVAGRNLSGSTFGEEVGERPTAVVFLRHYG
ncbi:hypothetical protein Pla163_03770 [Planctomycetes bacterium Pla163]|uniref:Uncharacterized protein n=1 Tax=Rohdeia mirabilis TaxID=2528008 RepID=A0A518CVM6_9BACT|nr:hypothetical protein Pla163_03770 [Planctomycetes bacterium Pla163]